MRVSEVWEGFVKGKFRPKIQVEWNYCGCHPNDVTVIWGRGFYQGATYVNENKSAFTKQKMKRGWKRLSRKVINENP